MTGWQQADIERRNFIYQILNSIFFSVSLYSARDDLRRLLEKVWPFGRRAFVKVAKNSSLIERLEKAFDEYFAPPNLESSYYMGNNSLNYHLWSY